MVLKDADHPVHEATGKKLPQKLSTVSANTFLVEKYILHHSQKPNSFLKKLGKSVSRNLIWITLLVILTSIFAIWMSAVTPEIYRATAVLNVAAPNPKNQSDTINNNKDLSREFVSVNYQILNNGNLTKALEQKLDQQAIALLANKNSPFLFHYIYQLATEFFNSLGIIRRLDETNQLSKLLSAIEIQQLANSSLIKISVYAFNGKVASDTANTAAIVAMEMIQQRESAAIETVLVFYENKLHDAKAQYEIADAERRNFVAENNIMSPEQRVSYLRSLQSAVNALKQKVAEKENEYKNFKLDHSNISSSLIDALTKQKASLDEEYLQKLVDLKPMHPDMLALTKKIKALDQQITLQKSQYGNTVRNSYQQYNLALNRAIENLQKFESDSTRYPLLELEYRKLSQKSELAAMIFYRLKQLYENLKSTSSNNSNLTLINEATPPLEPFENRLKENFIFAFFLSLLGSFIIVFVSIYRDRVYKSAQDLESDHGIPVIASIPNTAGLKTAKQIFNLMSLKPNNHLFEAYRKAADALYFSSEDGLPRVFAVTSANINEGKTLTSFALALEYSSAGQKVLLVDVHLRDPKLHQIFNIENHHGLTNILVSDEAPINVTHDTPFSNLYLICAGPSPANPTQLLASNRLGEFLDVAKQNFDLIILDCPAINVLDEMLLVGAVADHLVICLRSETTTKISVKKAIKKILSIQRLPTGFILTDQQNSFYSKFQFKNKVNVKKISESSRSSLLSKKVIPTH